MTRTLVEQQFGPHAGLYAASEVHAKGESLARLVSLLAPRADWRVLDVATGAGHMAMAVAPYVRAIVASDVTDEMLAETARGAASKGVANITTARAEATALGFPDASFDAVVCRLAAHHFADVGAFVSEVRRVLVPGGVFGLVDNVAPDATTLPNCTAEELTSAADLYNEFERLRDPSHARALTSAEWRALVHQHGLAIRAEELLAKELEFDPYVQRMSCTSDTIARLREMLESGPRPLRAFLQPRVAGAGLMFTLRELILVAVKPG